MTIEDLRYYLQKYLTEEERKEYLQLLYYRKQMIENGILSKGQLIELKSALERIFYKYEIKEKIDFEDTEISNASYIELFLSAKKRV